MTKDLRNYTRRIDPKFIPPLNTVMVTGAIVSQLQMRKHPENERWDKCSFVMCNYQPARNKEGETRWISNIIYVKCWGHMARRVYERRKKWDPIIVQGKLVHHERMDGRYEAQVAARTISLISTIMHKETFEEVISQDDPSELPEDAWLML